VACGCLTHFKIQASDAMEGDMRAVFDREGEAKAARLVENGSEQIAEYDALQ
jgi:hypothetical protein